VFQMQFRSYQHQVLQSDQNVVVNKSKASSFSHQLSDKLCPLYPLTLNHE
jgi:hypothetical protein